MASENQVDCWPVEHVPDGDNLYMRAHKNHFKQNGNLAPGVFRLRPHEGGMSTDWSEYSTPDETRQRGRVPADNAVLSLNVGMVRAIPQQTVAHTPLPANRTHTDVLGEKDEHARVFLRRAPEIVLPL